MARRMLRLRLRRSWWWRCRSCLWLILPVFSGGARRRRLPGKIDAKRRQIEAKKGRERVLTTTIAGYTRRINLLQADINVLQNRQARIQADLDAKRAELARIQERLRQRADPAGPPARAARRGPAALSKRLVEIYKADKPDVVTVILESDGFAELLERGGVHPARVRPGRAHHPPGQGGQGGRDRDGQAARQARGAAGEDHARGRSRGATRSPPSRAGWSTAAASVEGVRAGKQRALASTRERRHSLEGDLRVLEREQARITARLAGGLGRAGRRARSAQGSGQLIWPVNGPIASPFGQRWGRLHAGFDIAVPAGTPIRAADSGKVVLLGWTGGYGNYTCIAHGGALSTCYAHQSRYGTSMGAR